jgi:hypothetical protein
VSPRFLPQLPHRHRPRSLAGWPAFRVATFTRLPRHSWSSNALEDVGPCWAIYGVSAWGLKLDGAKQENLIITRENEPEITVDNIEVAQFVYLMLNTQKVRDVIDTITSKAVLILGRFTDKRKAVLDALREELRKRNYLPMLFRL